MQRECLRHFVGERRLGWVARVLLKVNALWPAEGLLPEVQLRNGHDRCQEGMALGEPGHVAFQIGTPGPYQKASALYVTAQGEGVALAKTAMTPTADAMVRGEAAWLEVLAGIDTLANQVPLLHGEGQTAEGRQYLVTSVAPSTRSCATFGAAHERFLGTLGRARLETGRFADSPCAQALEQRLELLHEILPEGRVAALSEAISDCQSLLADYRGPLVLAQGDFAPWNIRVNGKEVFVFDWEYATEGANPLADVLHFLLMPRAAAAGAISSRRLGAALRRAQAFARQMYPEWRWDERTVSALGLVYLLEVLLHFSLASGRFEARNPVIAAYWRLTRERSSWLTS